MFNVEIVLESHDLNLITQMVSIPTVGQSILLGSKKFGSSFEYTVSEVVFDALDNEFIVYLEHVSDDLVKELIAKGFKSYNKANAN